MTVPETCGWRSWTPADFVARRVEGPKVQRLLEELQKTHVNGGPICGAVQVKETGDPPRRLGTAAECVFGGLLCALERSDALRLALPDLLELGESPSSPTWTHVDAYGIASEWTQMLVTGGVYDRFRGPRRDAWQICSDAFSEITEGRTDEVLAFHTDEAWTGFFYGLASSLDPTWLLVDRRLGVITVLCNTDTD